MKILASVHGRISGKTQRMVHRTRIEVPEDFEREYRYDSIDDLPELIRDQVETGPLTETNYVYLEKDTEPAWNRCPQCEWPHVLHGILVEEAIISEADGGYYHDPVDWVVPKYLKCAAQCGWKHEYEVNVGEEWPDVPTMMIRLHFQAEKERAHASQH